MGRAVGRTDAQRAAVGGGWVGDEVGFPVADPVRLREEYGDAGGAVALDRALPRRPMAPQPRLDSRR
jgi:hypothetical protein